jgi:hypothetical protein
MRLSHISPAGENNNLATLPVFPAVEAGPYQNLIAEKLAHGAVSRFAAFRHLDWYRSVLPPA